MKGVNKMQLNEYLETVNALWKKNMPKQLPNKPYYRFGEVPVTDYLKQRAELTPNKACMIYYGTELSFKELDTLSSRFASFLASKGLQKGDRVAVFMSNCPQFNIAFYGILKLGCIYVPINPMFKEDELLYELQDTQAKIIVTTDQLYALVENVKDKTDLQEIVTTSLADYLPENPTIPVHPMYQEARKECPNTIDMLTSLVKYSEQYPKVEITLDDVAALNYTGGTTGLPKGCVHTQRDMLYTSASSCTYVFQLSENDMGLVYWPSFWIAGEILCLLNPVISGATHIILGRWDPETVLIAIEKYRVSYINGGVDNMVELIETPNVKQYDLRSLRITAVSSLSKKLDINYRRIWKELTGSIMMEATWGMTETNTYDTFTSFMQEDDFDLNNRPVFVGLPVPGTEFKVADYETGDLLPLGQEGELLVRTPALLKSYWNKPEETSKALKDGWLSTGDMGLIDEEGYIHFLGRNKEMLKVNGMSVFPPEVEVILSKHPAVDANGIVGMPDDKKGEVPVAFVLVKKEFKGKVSEESIQDWCKQNMATYKVPIIKIVEELPMTATGKVIKVELQKRLGDIVNQYIRNIQNYKY